MSKPKDKMYIYMYVCIHIYIYMYTYIKDKQIQNNGLAHIDIIMDRNLITGTTQNKIDGD
jgi:hypothetical protein